MRLSKVGIALVLFAVTVVASISCGRGEPGKSENGKLAPLPAEEIRRIAERCVYIDILFYTNSASMSQDEAASIRSTIGFITEAPVEGIACPARGRIAFMGEGTIIAEADIHVEEKCGYLVFIEEQQPVYANMMTREGGAFFANILGRIEGTN